MSRAPGRRRGGFHRRRCPAILPLPPRSFDLLALPLAPLASRPCLGPSSRPERMTRSPPLTASRDTGEKRGYWSWEREREREEGQCLLDMPHWFSATAAPLFFYFQPRPAKKHITKKKTKNTIPPPTHPLPPSVASCSSSRVRPSRGTPARASTPRSSPPSPPTSPPP